MTSGRDNQRDGRADRVRDGRPGHFGLKGMRERAEKIGGSLKVESEHTVGTTVELTLPGTIAYEPEHGSLG